MSVPKLHNPDMDKDKQTRNSVDGVLKWASEYQKERPPDGYFASLWFRGVSDSSFDLIPDVYRLPFTERAKSFWLDQYYRERRSEPDADAKLERRRLNLERIIIRDFLQAGGHLLEAKDDAEAYFLARHFGMPTRLLDWSSNPLVALFMAVADEDNPKNLSTQGAVYAIDPTSHLPERERPFRSILTPDHAFAKDAIQVVMRWQAPDKPAYILPIRPNTRSGRMERQASCFTLHAYGSKETQNPTLRRCLIPALAKDPIRKVLSGLSINQFTVYNTVDRLAREFRKTWGIEHHK